MGPKKSLRDFLMQQLNFLQSKKNADTGVDNLKVLAQWMSCPQLLEKLTHLASQDQSKEFLADLFHPWGGFVSSEGLPLPDPDLGPWAVMDEQGVVHLPPEVKSFQGRLLFWDWSLQKEDYNYLIDLWKAWTAEPPWEGIYPVACPVNYDGTFPFCALLKEGAFLEPLKASPVPFILNGADVTKLETFELGELKDFKPESKSNTIEENKSEIPPSLLKLAAIKLGHPVTFTVPTSEEVEIREELLPMLPFTLESLARPDFSWPKVESNLTA